MVIFRLQKNLDHKKIYGYLIKGFLNADVDTNEDFKKAKEIYKKNRGFIK